MAESNTELIPSLVDAISSNDVLKIRGLVSLVSNSTPAIIYATKTEGVTGKCLETLLKLNFDPNIRDKNGTTALHIAANNNYTEKLGILLQCPLSKVNALDRSGRNALHCLIEGQCFDDVEDLKAYVVLLVNKGVDINTQDNMGETPLHKIFQNYTREIPRIVTSLFQSIQGIDFTLRDHQDSTVFHLMVSGINESHKDSKEYDTLIDEKENMIYSFLSGEITVVSDSLTERLLNDLDKTGNSAFTTYLDNDHMSFETLQVMINKRADINAQNSLGITPLMKVVFSQYDDVVEILLKNGASVEEKDIFGQSAIFRARTVRSFKLLCQHGADILERDKFGRSPAANCLVYGPSDFPTSGLTIRSDLSTNQPLAVLFFEHGLDVNTTDKYGSTFLHYAAWHSDMDMIKVLLRYGARRDIKDVNGLTPLDLAVKQDSYEVISLLQPEYAEEDQIVTTDVQMSSYEKSTRFVKHIIHHQDAEDMLTTLKIANLSCDPAELISTLMKSPRTGLTSNLPESVKVKNDIRNLMDRIACYISAADSRFQCSVFQTGSSAEGTQIGDPSEMDFAFCLSVFNNTCEIVQTDALSQTGFAKLKLKDLDESHSLAFFANEDGFVRSDLVRGLFQDLVTQAVNRPDIWVSDHLYFDGLLSYPADKPIVNMRVHWYGAVVKSLQISIDMVPVIRRQKWIPKEVDLSSSHLCSNEILDVGYFLLFHEPNNYLEEEQYYVRVSSAPLEIMLLKTMPSAIRESYSIAKTLKSYYFCPHAQFSDDDEDYEDDDDDDDDDEDDDDGVGEDKDDDGVDEDKDDDGVDEDKDATDEEEDFDNEDDVGDEEDVVEKTGYTDNVQEKILDKSTPTSNDETNSTSKQKVTGWVVTLDEKKTVKSLHLPKNNDVKHIEKMFKKLKEEAEYTESISETGERILTPSDQKVNTYEVKLMKRSNQKRNEDFPSLEKKHKADLDREKRVDSDETEQKHTSTSFDSNAIPEDETHKMYDDGSLKISKGIHFFPSNVPTEGNMVPTKASLNTGEDPQNNSQTSDTIAKDSQKTHNDENEEHRYSGDNDSFQDDSSNDDEEVLEGGDVASACDEISSYMLKNALFYMMEKSSITDLQNMSHVEMTKMIYETLLQAAQERNLPAYFLPYIDIFSYVNTHIRMVPENKADQELDKHCKRIETFCKIIIGILSQNH